MNEEAKKRIVAAVDSLAKDGVSANRLVMSHDTARKFGINATHIDLSSETLMHHRDRIAAELTHESYDPKSSGGGGPLAPVLATEIAKARCHAFMRREVVLTILIDNSVPVDRFRVEGSSVTAKEA